MSVKTTYRGLDKLTPSMRKKVEGFLGEVNKEKEIIFITETWRSAERQKYLVSIELSQVSRSLHQDGLAVDIAFRGKELYPTDMKIWRKVADIGKKHGLDWGFDLWGWDKPHFQYNSKILPLIDNRTMTTNYTEILAQELQASGLDPIFTDFSGDQPMTEKTVKEVIAIACLRLEKRLQKKK